MQHDILRGFARCVVQIPAQRPIERSCYLPSANFTARRALDEDTQCDFFAAISEISIHLYVDGDLDDLRDLREVLKAMRYGNM